MLGSFTRRQACQHPLATGVPPEPYDAAFAAPGLVLGTGSAKCSLNQLFPVSVICMGREALPYCARSAISAAMLAAAAEGLQASAVGT
jgi:hypothetical protein